MLVYPNQKWQKNDNTTWNLNPATLCLLAAMVKEYVEVKIIDAQFYDLSKKEFLEELQEFNPDYVGISSLTSEYGEILHITSNLIKEFNQNIITIAGGIHPTIEYRKVVEDNNINYIVRGEGEYTLKNLILYLNGASDLPTEGLVYKIGDELIIQDHVLTKDIANLPWPDYNYIKLEDYIYTGPRVGPLRAPEYPYMRLMVTRGCPVGCSFCQVETISGRQVRARDPEDVVAELLYYKEKYGIKSLIFDDDNMMANKKFFYSMLEIMIEKKLELKFIIEAFAIFTLTDKMLDLLKRAGCVGVNIAVESGNERVLKEVVLKPVKLHSVAKKVNQIQQADMFVLANFIIGFPGETWAEIRETISFAESCGADYVKIFVALPLKGTKLWNIASKLKVLAVSEDKMQVDWRYSQIKSDEWTTKDISILRAYEWDRINFATPEKIQKMSELWGVSIEELNKIRKETRDSLQF